MPEKQSVHFPQRRSIRLKGYDYSSAGGYFITIVTKEMTALFGEVIDGVMHINEFGTIAQKEWFKTQELRPQVELFEDEFVVMPNHIHGIIWIIESENGLDDRPGMGDLQVARTTFVNPAVRTNFIKQDARTTFINPGRPLGPASKSLGAIIAGYKSAVTARINTIRQVKGMPVWHRNYYEHIIGTEREYDNIVNYIAADPENWGLEEDFFLT